MQVSDGGASLDGTDDELTTSNDTVSKWPRIFPTLVLAFSAILVTVECFGSDPCFSDSPKKLLKIENVEISR